MLLGMYIERCVSWWGQERFEHASPVETKLKDCHVCAVQNNSIQTVSQLRPNCAYNSYLFKGKPRSYITCVQHDQQEGLSTWVKRELNQPNSWVHILLNRQQHALTFLCQRADGSALFNCNLSGKPCRSKWHGKVMFCSNVCSIQTCHFWFGAIFPVLHVLALMCSSQVHSPHLFIVL